MAFTLPRLRPSALLAALLTFAFCPGAFAQAEEPAPEPTRPSKLVPSLPKAARIDGNVGELKNGLALAPSMLSSWSGRVGVHKDTLHLGVVATDDKVLNGDILQVSIFFPGAGVTARGFTWRYAVDGQRAPAEGELPGYAEALTHGKVVKTDDGLTLEMAIPARALPRFPAKDPMVFELCVTFEDRDAPAESPKIASNCKSGTMTGEALRLPDEFRKALKLKPSEQVVGLEGRKSGWVGYAILHYPVWVSYDGKLDAEALRSLVTEEAADPKAAGVNLPDSLLLPGKRTVLSVLSGKDPYAEKGKCDADSELRVGLYLVQGQTAERVLEWPVSTCALGRAVAFELDEEGELTVGYTNGGTVTFRWSKDHFERTEIGSR